MAVIPHELQHGYTTHAFPRTSSLLAIRRIPLPLPLIASKLYPFLALRITVPMLALWVSKRVEPPGFLFCLITFRHLLQDLFGLGEGLVDGE